MPVPTVGPPELISDDAEPRTSVLAVVSLILALVCFVPGLGAVAAVLGSASLVRMARSRGLLAGRGLAIVAVVLGLLSTVLWLGAALGVGTAAAYATRTVIRPVSSLLASIEAGDWSAARAALSPAVQAHLTDAQLEAFRSAYQASAGRYVSMPATAWEMLAARHRARADFSFRPDAGHHLPLVARFERGMCLVVVVVEPGPTQRAVSIRNLMVRTAAGQEAWLVSPAGPTGADGTPARARQDR